MNIIKLRGKVIEIDGVKCVELTAAESEEMLSDLKFCVETKPLILSVFAEDDLSDQFPAIPGVDAVVQRIIDTGGPTF